MSVDLDVLRLSFWYGQTYWDKDEKKNTKKKYKGIHFRVCWCESERLGWEQVEVGQSGRQDSIIHFFSLRPSKLVYTT